MLDPAIAEAARVGADIVLANDPDADRLAVAVPAGDGTARWRVLSGDELGAILGDHLLARAGATARTAGDGTPAPVVATSIVSSTLLAKLAEASGARFVETLTGFKWIARAADGMPGARLLFGYEEALGYAVSDAVRDKDGISAGLLAAELAAAGLAAGRPLTARLDELEQRFGVHLTSQWSLRLDGEAAAAQLAATLGRWQSTPPRALAGMPVAEAIDLERGLGALPPAPGVLLRFGGWVAHGNGDRALRARVIVRPSGTEPKLKVYLEVVVPPGAVAGAGLAAARAAASRQMSRLRVAVAEALTP